MAHRAVSFIIEHPALWPAVVFAIVAPIHILRADPQKRSAHFTAREGRVLVACGIAAIALFIFSLVSYLSSNGFLDLWESLSGSIAALLRRGQRVYPDLSTEERYASPYGPFLFITLAASQWLFGASAFGTKLPCVLAALISVGLLWLIVYRRSGSAPFAFVFAGLESALLLAFRIQAFWPKPDGLILLMVSAALVGVLRCNLFSQSIVGVCLGVAIGLKPHAAVYFLPLIPLAQLRGWKLRDFIGSGAAALCVAAAPFIAFPTHFSFRNYILLLAMTAHEGFSFGDALRFLKWVGLLAALIIVVDRWQRSAVELSRTERRFRLRYRVAIAVALALAAVPGAAIGAGPRHVMPFIPLILWDVSSRFCKGEIQVCGRDRPTWRLLAYCAAAACLMVAIQTVGRVLEWRTAGERAVLAQQAELRRVLADYKHANILMGAGSDQHRGTLMARHELTFAGHPIGIDVASAMDYQRARLPEPNLQKLTAELRGRGREIVWVVPHGEPFTTSNIYDGQPLFSDGFRREFHEAFHATERRSFFDVYSAKAPPPDTTDAPELRKTD